MNFEVLALEYLYENPSDIKKISEFFSKDENECRQVLASLLEDSFVYMPKAGKYSSTPAGMEYVKKSLEENEIKALPGAITPGMKYPTYVISASKDKRKVMGIYDRRLGRLDVYPVLPDAMCESGFGGAILEAHLYRSVMLFKGIIVTKNGKSGFFKTEGTDISLAKRELDFAILTLDALTGKIDIKNYVSELKERRVCLATVTDGAHIALNEGYVLEEYFNPSMITEKRNELFTQLYDELGKIKAILDKGKGLSKIPRLLKADLTALC